MLEHQYNFLLINFHNVGGSLEGRLYAHDLKVVGSNPTKTKIFFQILIISNFPGITSKVLLDQLVI